MKDRVCEFKCNIDDMTAEEIAYASERLMEAGAKDVTVEAAGMKKGRVGAVLTVMCADEEAARDEMIRLIFRYTTTIGIRELISERYILDRTEEVHETPYGKVRFKTVSGYGTTRRKPEYDDLAAIARDRDVSIAEARRLVLESLEEE